jgi:adenylate cyclase
VRGAIAGAQALSRPIQRWRQRIAKGQTTVGRWADAFTHPSRYRAVHMSDQDAAWPAERLAEETETTTERIGSMVAAGILKPGPGGEFQPGDVQRVLVANAMDEAGLTLDLMKRGIELGIVSFDQTDEIYPYPGPRSRRSVAQLAADLGLSTDLLLRVITAFGLPRPDPDTHLRVPDEEQLQVFVDAWRPLGGDEILVRAARIFGDGLRRAAEGQVSLFEEAVMGPLADRAIPWSELSAMTLEPGLPVLAAARGMLQWMVDQHLAQSLNRLNFDSIERMLAISGIDTGALGNTAAIVFADLAGYTRLTEERGDEIAATAATRLASLADEIASRHHGRLVKLLGDGVMLHFRHPADALPAALELRDAMAPAGLPPAHTAIHAGPVIRRESDYFGRTVNLASRLAAQAGPNRILVTPALLQAAPGLPDGAGTPEPMPPLELKGIPEPVEALRIGPA